MNRKIHFFKARSRLGLKNPPIHSKKLNLGVEDGPEAILTGQFLAKFEYRLSQYSFPKPEDIPADQFDQVLAKSIQDFKELILKNLAKNELQVVIGGDHSVTLPSVLAVLNRINTPKEVCYVQFDSHGDINLSSTSPTGNFHGMYVRPLVDYFDIPEVEKLVSVKLSASNMFYIGNLDLDPGEKDFFRKHQIKHFNRKQIKDQKAIKMFQTIVNNFKHLHVTFDIDCMDKKEAPATGIPSDDGLFFKDLVPFLKIISKCSNFSFDLVEVNPKKRGAGKTITLAQKILSTVLS